MSDVLDCQLNARNSPITVGEIMWLKCSDMPLGAGVQLHDEEATQAPDKNAQTSPEDKTKGKPLDKSYRLVLLSGENTDQGLKVTSYRVGDHQISKIILEFGEKKYNTSPLQFSVRSVLDPKSQPQPFPSFPPMMPRFPLSIWIVFFVTLISLIATVTHILLRSRKRRAYLKQLKSSEGYAAPYSHFHQTLRSLRKVHLQNGQPDQFVLGLEPALRILLEQTFHEPISLTDIKWLKRLQQRPQQSEELHTFAMRRLAELARLQKREKVSVQDAEQMEKEICALVDRLEPLIAPLRGRR